MFILANYCVVGETSFRIFVHADETTFSNSILLNTSLSTLFFNSVCSLILACVMTIFMGDAGCNCSQRLTTKPTEDTSFLHDVIVI